MIDFLTRRPPPPSVLEERSLIARAQSGDLGARDELVTRHLSFVSNRARKLLNRGVELDDLVQEGALGLLRALEDFDPSMGKRFLTYAGWWVFQHMQVAIAKGGLVRSPRADTRIAGSRQARCARNAAQSLDTMRGENDGYTLGSSLADPRDDFAALEDAEERGFLAGDLDVRLASLDCREEFILRARANGRILHDIGVDLQITRERVRQIEIRALAKLRSGFSWRETG